MSTFDNINREAATARDPRHGARVARIWRRPPDDPLPQDRGSWDVGRDRILCHAVRCGGEFPLGFLYPVGITVRTSQLARWHLEGGIWRPGREHRQRRNRVVNSRIQDGAHWPPVAATITPIRAPFWFECPVPSCRKVSVVTGDALALHFPQ